VTGPAMPKLISECIDDVTVYLVVNDFGTPGCAFVETGISEANRETVLRNFLTGQYSNALRVVVAFNTVEGWSRGVSEDLRANYWNGHTTATTFSPRLRSASSRGI
jgi:hypothetical protein